MKIGPLRRIDHVGRALSLAQSGKGGAHNRRCVQAGLIVHHCRFVLIDEDIFQHHRAHFEAVFEQMDVKQEVFTKLDATMKDGALILSNTSALDIDEIASVTKRPQDIAGAHFFSPANVMKLLEVVKGKESSRSEEHTS